MIHMSVLEIIEHVVEHTIADTLYLIPFLFVTFVLMEWIEHKTGKKTQQAIRRAGLAGPIVGGVLGAVPQCGFSAAAAALYAGRVVSLGTLFAVFLATSDEMIPIFLAQKVDPATTFSILGFKVAAGIIVGFVIDLGIRLFTSHDDRLRIHELCADDNCGCEEDCLTCMENPDSVYDHHDDCTYGCTHEFHEHEHKHDKHGGWKHILKSSTIHTAKVMVFILVVTFVLNIILETAGEEFLEGILGGDNIGSIILAALIGLIPNCAASVVIAQMYVRGVLGAAAMIAGLLVSAGIGLLVLCRTNRNFTQNAAIIMGLFLTGVLGGIVVMVFNITF